VTPAANTSAWSPGFVAPPWARTPFGLGDAQEAQYAKLATGAATTAVGALSVPSIAILTPLMATGIGLALVGVGIALQMLFTRKGPGQKIKATEYANGAEPILRDNMQLYLKQPIRTVTMQRGALANFDATWAKLVQLCGDPALGDAGKRCISERQKGGVAPWCDKPGHLGCDWFVYYRDPIANDPDVKPDASLLDKAVALITGGSSSAAAPGSAMNPAATAAGSKAGLFIGLALVLGVGVWAATGD
jgi:hypothetical protein